ncbi:uncharacterized protein TNCV_1291511 [Trichonephila clavipes]|nr:uncharacterized protein TNCV_1291511 [Trichonephila clavipes]
MPLRRNRRQYEQLTDFDRGRIRPQRSSDESRFSLSDDDTRRRTGQRSDPAFIVERHTAIRCDSVGEQFLGHTIIFSGPSRHFDSSQIRGNVDCATHAIKSPRCHLDNARPHTARLSQQCLQGYDVLPWPARSR